MSTEYARIGLAHINQYRAQRNAPPLEWNWELEKKAKDHAINLLNRREGEPLAPKQGIFMGQNLFELRKKGSGLQYVSDEELVERAIDTWFDDCIDYQPNSPPGTIKGKSFSQLVWKTTQQVGLGIARKEMENSMLLVVIGFFNPPGNYKGEFEKNVCVQNLNIKSIINRRNERESKYASNQRDESTLNDSRSTRLVNIQNQNTNTNTNQNYTNQINNRRDLSTTDRRDLASTGEENSRTTSSSQRIVTTMQKNMTMEDRNNSLDERDNFVPNGQDYQPNQNFPLIDQDFPSAPFQPQRDEFCERKESKTERRDQNSMSSENTVSSSTHRVMTTAFKNVRVEEHSNSLDSRDVNSRTDTQRTNQITDTRDSNLERKLPPTIEPDNFGQDIRSTQHREQRTYKETRVTNNDDSPYAPNEPPFDDSSSPASYPNAYPNANPNSYPNSSPDNYRPDTRSTQHREQRVIKETRVIRNNEDSPYAPNEPPFDDSSSPASYPNAYPNANPNSYPNSSPNSYPKANPNANPNSNPNSYANSYPNSSPNSYPNSNPETFGPDIRSTQHREQRTYKETRVTTNDNSPYAPNEPPFDDGSSPASYPNANPNSYPNSNPNANPTSYPNANPTSYPNANPNTNPNSNPNSYPNSSPNSYPNANPETFGPDIRSTQHREQRTYKETRVTTNDNSPYAPNEPPFDDNSSPASYPNAYPNANPNSYPNSSPNSYPNSNPNSYPKNNDDSPYAPNEPPFDDGSSPASYPNAYPNANPNSYPNSNPDTRSTQHREQRVIKETRVIRNNEDSPYAPNEPPFNDNSSPASYPNAYPNSNPETFGPDIRSTQHREQRTYKETRVTKNNDDSTYAPNEPSFDDNSSPSSYPDNFGPDTRSTQQHREQRVIKETRVTRNNDDSTHSPRPVEPTFDDRSSPNSNLMGRQSTSMTTTTKKTVVTMSTGDFQPNEIVVPITQQSSTHHTTTTKKIVNMATDNNTIINQQTLQEPNYNSDNVRNIHTDTRTTKQITTKLTETHRVAVEIHNEIRKKHNASTVTIDQQLCDDAQTYAKSVITKTEKKETVKRVGRNVYQMTGSGQVDPTEAIKKAMDKWYSKIDEYNWEDPMSSGPGAKNFTQLIWKQCRTIGVAVETCTKTRTTCVVVLYDPPGNVSSDRQYKDNVQRPLY